MGKGYRLKVTDWLQIGYRFSGKRYCNRSRLQKTGGYRFVTGALQICVFCVTSMNQAVTLKNTTVTDTHIFGGFSGTEKKNDIGVRLDF